MTTDSHVVIVVSNTPVDDEIIEDENESISPTEKCSEENNYGSTDQSKNPHLLLAKFNSFPITERPTKDHLSVPSTFSNYETVSSLYSSQYSLYYQSDCDGYMSDNPIASSSEDFATHDPQSASVRHLPESTQMSTKKRHHIIPIRLMKSLQHLPLKRTISAPLKTSLDDNLHTRACCSVEDLSNKEHPVVHHRNNNNPQRINLFSPMPWKRSLLRHPDDKLSSSRFSLRRTLSSSFRNSFHGKDTCREISFPSRNKKKASQTYRIVEARTGQNDGISFEVIGKQGMYLRVKGSMLVPDKDTGDSYFNKDASFVPLPNMWFPSFFAFESVSKPSYFIRRLITDEELVLDKYDGTKEFKEESSFQLKRKPCATCLQVGVETWARTPTGEYCLGRVITINNDGVEVRFNDGKIEKYLKLDTGQFVPDVVPCPEDISIGTRVIAQWLQRDTLYPGVVSSIDGRDNYEVLFDDGDMGREKTFQIRLMRTYSFSHCLNHALNRNSAVIDGQSATQTCEDAKTNTTQQSEAVQKEGGAQSILWSVDSTLESPPISDFMSNFTPSNTTSETIPDPAIRPSSSKHFTFAPWEIETFSQDSGYHGYDKGNSTLNTNTTLDKNGNKVKQIRRKLGWIPNLQKQALLRQHSTRYTNTKYCSCQELSSPSLTSGISSFSSLSPTSPRSKSVPTTSRSREQLNKHGCTCHKNQNNRPHRSSDPGIHTQSLHESNDSQIGSDSHSLNDDEEDTVSFSASCQTKAQENDENNIDLTIDSISTDTSALMAKSPCKVKDQTDTTPKTQSTNSIKYKKFSIIANKMDVIRERSDSICQTSII